MTTRCPYCFELVGGAAIAFRCAQANCTPRADPTASKYAGEQVKAAAVSDLPPGASRKSTSVQCRACGGSATVPACPICHATLPPDWFDTATTCIAMAGARASGKSIYIAVLAQQAALLMERLGSSMRPLNGRFEQAFVDLYQSPLYVQRGLIPATSRHATAAAGQRVPLIFSLGVIDGQRHALVIRDVAGEDLEDGTANPMVFGFFRHADAVFFLFDPLRVKAIRDLLEGIVPEQRVTGGDPLTVLDNLVRLLRHDGRPVTTPLAVIVAKFDTLYELRRVTASPWGPVMKNSGAAFARDPSLESAAFDQHDAALLDAEMTSLLTRLNGKALLHKLEAEFAERQLFAVSALGASPSGQSLDARGIAPFRCTDPLKWVLARSGVLSSA